MSLPMRPADVGDARAAGGGAGFSDADSRWIEAFEAATLPDGAFHHRDHVRTAWIYLRRLPPATALDRFARGLRRFAEAKGKPGLYHETITWAYLLLIRGHMERDGSEGSFDEFAARHPDLLAWNPSILDSYYRRETLWSDLARRVFVMPDLAARESVLHDFGRVIPSDSEGSRNRQAPEGGVESSNESSGSLVADSSG